MKRNPTDRPLISTRGGLPVRARRMAGSRWLHVLALCAFLGGCCSQAWKSIFIGLVKNATTVVKAVEKTISAQYYSAVQDVIKVVSCFNTSCPPRRIKPEVLSTLPLEVDFNLLHEFIGPNDRVQVTTVPAASPDQLKSKIDVQRLYGVSESDNYKFVFVSHQDLYVYVFQIDATGEVAWQFPRYVAGENGMREEINPWHDAEGMNPVPAEQLTRMPENVDDWLYLNQHGRNGVENFFLVASKYRQTELEEKLANAVRVAQEEKSRDPSKFTETIVDLPLVIPENRSGLVNDADGVAKSETRSIQTEAGPVAYTPRTFEGAGDTIVMVRSVLHLPPRTP